ncbi:nucleophile aminohydrolase [Tribonema minus]|uniref:Proteasome subunit alpha type n=1 Tax=Tribonema minus TaxID=303371 RepID=A0A835YYM9_9STRA|nr:nucleophile aminohydrolase [Tribonema minus]
MTSAVAVSGPEHNYDFTASVFSPKGRLYQVDYARAAVDRAKPCIGIKTSEGILLCSLRQAFPLQDPDFTQKVHIIDRHIVATGCGLVSDAAQLVRETRKWTLKYRLEHQEGMPVEAVVSTLCDIKQVFTQRGGLRPWGVSFLVAGYDHDNGLQLYKTDPGGNFGAFEAAVVGSNSTLIAESLSQSLHDGVLTASLETAAAEAVRLLREFGLGGEQEVQGELQLEVAVVTVGEGGRVSAQVLSRAKVDALEARMDRNKPMESSVSAVVLVL